jgi:urease accessory protein
MTTRLAIEVVDGRHRTTMTAGLLRPQLVHSPPDRCRIGLLATTALLLGGDEVELEVELGCGATVELFDVAGTVAYHGRGKSAAWRVRLRLGPGARLRWSGEPLVVSDGADVLRTLDVHLAADAALLLRETLVLGRAGEGGGVLRTRTAVTRAGHALLLEEQLLDRAGHRAFPGMLGHHRLLDSIMTVGLPGTTGYGTASQFTLVDAGSTLTRYLGSDLASSPLHRAWRELVLGAIVATGPSS